MSRRVVVVSLAVSICVLVGGCRPVRESLPSPVRPLIPTPDEAFRRVPPAAGPPAPFRRPEVFWHRLDNGLTIALARRPGAATAAVRYVTRRGGEAISPALAGRAWLVGRLVERTLKDRRDGALSPVALHGGVAVDHDAATLSIRATTDRLDEAVELAAAAVRTPGFEQSRLEEERRAALDRMGWFGRSPERIALIRARGMLYGYDHRAAIPLLGSVQSVRSVTRAELMAFHHMSWGPRESVLVVVGDVEPSRLVAVADEAFGGWETERPPPADDEPWIALDSPHVARALGIESVAPRSTVVLVERAPARTSREYLPFAVLAVVLGGMPSSRLDVELRESDAGASGVVVSYDTRLAGGELVLAAEVGRRGNDIATAIGAFLEALTRMIEEGPGEAELAVAKTLVRERLRSSLEESDDAAAMIGEAFALGLGIDEIGRLDDDIDRITPRDVRDVARRWLRPDRAPIVVTGELNSISFAFNVADIGLAVVRP